MGILIILTVSVGVYLLYKQYGAPSKDGFRNTADPSSLEIAGERYARGEINREEYLRLKEDLEEDLK